MRGKYDIFSKIPLNLFLLASHMGKAMLCLAVWHRALRERQVLLTHREV